MYISQETPQETHARLLGVLAAAELKVLEGTWAFVEVPVFNGPTLHRDAIACVRDDEVWSELVPSNDERAELFKVFRFHFRSGLDNSGFVGWLASHLKAKLGTAVFVVCGQNSGHGGIFDYWGCPARMGDAVLAEVRNLASPGKESGTRSLNGARMWAATTDAQGEVNRETILEFTENGQTISARIFRRTGSPRVPRRHATARPCAFVMPRVDESGRIDGGRSECELKLLDDGRLALVAHFEWESRPGSGTNVFEEIPLPESS